MQCPPKYPPPPPPTNDGYYPTFSNITAATQADDYQTFGLVDTVAREYFRYLMSSKSANAYRLLYRVQDYV